MALFVDLISCESCNFLTEKKNSYDDRRFGPDCSSCVAMEEGCLVQMLTHHSLKFLEVDVTITTLIHFADNGSDFVDGEPNAERLYGFV